MRTVWPAVVLLAACAAGLAADVFADDFDDNRQHWRLDEQWTLADGELRGSGLAGQVLAVGCDAPPVSDFRARLTARQVGQSGAGNFGFGLLYRFDAQRRSGCFVALGAEQGYGFGRVTDGEFALVMQGRSGLIDLAKPFELTLEAVGDRHVLRLDGQLLDVWRDEPRQGQGFGLLLIDQVDVAFDRLELERLGSGQPPVPKFGPPKPGTDAKSLGTADIELAAEWRRHFNRAADARGAPRLADTLDVVDIAVLALLKRANLTGEVPPAEVLVSWLKLPEMAAAKALGPGPAAALEFWLQYAESQPAGDQLGGPEDLLAGLDWYDAVRATTAAGWGERGPEPLLVGKLEQDRVDLDRKRFEAPLNEAERTARQAEFAALLDEVLELADALPAQD